MQYLWNAIRWTFVRYFIRFQLTWLVARSLGNRWASCKICSPNCGFNRFFCLLRTVLNCDFFLTNFLFTYILFSTSHGWNIMCHSVCIQCLLCTLVVLGGYCWAKLCSVKTVFVCVLCARRLWSTLHGMSECWKARQTCYDMHRIHVAKIWNRFVSATTGAFSVRQRDIFATNFRGLPDWGRFV